MARKKRESDEVEQAWHTLEKTKKSVFSNIAERHKEMDMEIEKMKKESKKMDMEFKRTNKKLEELNERLKALLNA